MTTNDTWVPLIPDLPIKAMCCIICGLPAAAKVNTTNSTSGACIAHVRLVRKVVR